MRYAGLIKNDIAAGNGMNVTLFVQGCPIHCLGCQNPQTWNFLGGKEFTTETIQEIISALDANGIQRNFSIMGGEPLCKENLFMVSVIINTVKEKYPNIEIWIWTGYTYEELINQKEQKIDWILDNIDYLVDGPFILADRDITIERRGSSNQRILSMKELRKNGQ